MTDVVAAVPALNTADLEAFVSCYAPDARIEDGEGRVFATGHEELRRRYSNAFERYPALRVEAVSRMDVGPYVVEEERVTGRAPEPERHVAVYTVHRDVIVRERLLR